MAFSFELVDQELDLNREQPRMIAQFRAMDELPVLGDHFASTATAALLELSTAYPTFDTPYGTLYFNAMQMSENSYGQLYGVTATYTLNDKQVGAYQVTVDTTGGTVNVKEGTVQAVYGANAPALADAPETINVLGDDIRGVDIPVPQTKITVSFRHAQGILDQDYIYETGKLVGHPNDAEFLGYQPGEVLYLGGNFTQTEAEATATYYFAISYFIATFDVAGITVTNKEGWDLLDAVYINQEAGDRSVWKLDYFKTIRPAGRDWKDYGATFGWGT